MNVRQEERCVSSKPVHVTWASGSTPSRQVLQMGFLNEQFEGREPFVRRTNLDGRVMTLEQLIPPGADVVGCCEDWSGVITHLRHPLGSVCIEMYSRGPEVTVSASTPERLDELHTLVMTCVPERRDDEGVPMVVWLSDSGRASWRRRTFPTPSWRDIQINYPAPVRAQLDSLMRVREPQQGGRLVVWYGPPGTGKTNAIRALAAEWSPWCETHILADPEAFFASSSTIEEVLSSAPSVRQPPTAQHATVLAPHWRLVVAEDTDDLLQAVRNGHGRGALGRLFNLSDGIIGQGANVIFLITTNAPIHDIHPALTRPGRCLSRLEFERFSASEARAWLPNGAAARVNTPMTLAEMYELRGDHERIDHHHIAEPAGYL